MAGRWNSGNRNQKALAVGGGHEDTGREVTASGVGSKADVERGGGRQGRIFHMDRQDTTGAEDMQAAQGPGGA